MKPEVEILRDLVAIPSVSWMSNQPVIDYAMKRLEGGRWKIKLYPYRDGAGIAKNNLVATTKSQGDTKPELALRSRLHALGLRYRVSARPMPDIRRTADVVFTRARVAVFVDGCYWHGCPDHHRPARQNSGFWIQKIETNRQRDSDINQLLTQVGWEVIRVWEHEDPGEAAKRIESVVRARLCEQ